MNVTFWGSDDWAASPVVLELLINQFRKLTDCLTLLFVQVVMQIHLQEQLVVSLCFNLRRVRTASFRNALLSIHPAPLLPCSPVRYAQSIRRWFSPVSDLDYFLRLSRHPGLSILCLDLDLVHMADGGVRQQTWRRLLEVSRISLCSWLVLWFLR